MSSRLSAAVGAALLCAAAFPAAAAGPQPGAWEGTVTNRFVGHQHVYFTVTPSGEVTDFRFVGYWNCRDRTPNTQDLERLDPPAPFDISGGAFGGVQKDGTAGMWWEVTGAFGASGASGTYRSAWSGGVCDTLRYEWVAQPVR